jgi:hypothetical protein
VAAQEKNVWRRCAWCGRFEIDGAWHELGAGEAPPDDAISHGICQDCFDRQPQPG